MPETDTSTEQVKRAGLTALAWGNAIGLALFGPAIALITPLFANAYEGFATPLPAVTGWFMAVPWPLWVGLGLAAGAGAVAVDRSLTGATARFTVQLIIGLLAAVIIGLYVVAMLLPWLQAVYYLT